MNGSDSSVLLLLTKLRGILPSGSVVLSSVNAAVSSGRMVLPFVNAALSSGSAVLPSVNAALPSVNAVLPSGSAVLPFVKRLLSRGKYLRTRVPTGVGEGSREQLADLYFAALDEDVEQAGIYPAGWQSS